MERRNFFKLMGLAVAGLGAAVFGEKAKPVDKAMGTYVNVPIRITSYWVMDNLGISVAENENGATITGNIAEHESGTYTYTATSGKVYFVDWRVDQNGWTIRP